MEGLTAFKCSDSKFSSFLNCHDIICLTETWTNKDSTLDLKGYSKPIHSYRRLQHRRAKRSSGGIVIYIKDNIRKGVTLVKNDIDCIVWLKLDKMFFNIESDVYLCVVYIAPENSPVHSLYTYDIFQTIELDINFYQTKGKVFLTGDTNSRTGNKADYIENDRYISDTDFDTVPDIETLIPRSTCDLTTNRFGDNLLDICKATNIRIVNGRLHNDQNIGKKTAHTNLADI